MPTTKNVRSNNYTLQCWSSRHCFVCTFVHIHQAIGQDQFQNKKGFFCIFVIFGHFQSICNICHDQYRFLWTVIRGFIFPWQILLGQPTTYPELDCLRLHNLYFFNMICWEECLFSLCFKKIIAYFWDPQAHQWHKYIRKNDEGKTVINSLP